MIGYLRPLDLSSAERRLYRSYHCGICHTLKREYGLIYCALAGPDLVFFSLFLDAIAQDRPPLVRRSCVVAPIVTRQRMRLATDHALFAAAFGVYMVVEKVRDDYEDEGGWWRWLLLRLLRRGFRRARARLVRMGFGVVALERAMAAQAEIEKQPSLPLHVAMRPTVGIALQLFGHAARGLDRARAEIVATMGERLGRFLFFMDNALDLAPDLKKRRYNALAAASGVSGERQEGAARARRVGIDGARAEAGELAVLVSAVGAKDEYRGVLESVLARGLGDKVRRLERLDARQQQRATLQSIMPRASLGSRLRTSLSHLRKPAEVIWLRTRLAVILALMLLAPRWAWAASMAARLMASAPGADSEPKGDADPAGEEGGIYEEWICCDSCDVNDACAGACENACEATCGKVCGDACDKACADACDLDCCSSGGGGD